jgi:NAD(P)H-hydrate epimerase
MKICITSQIRELDRISIQDFKIPGSSLMENAGQGLFDLCTSLLKDIKKPRVLIFCGSGNNGGDGFTLGTMLLKKKIHAHVVLACPPDKIKGDAALWLRRYKRQKGTITKAVSSSEVQKLSLTWILKHHILVDALLGTGIKGAPRGNIHDLITIINNSEIPTVCVDTPSGMDNDTGQVPGACVRGDHTVTFGLPKLGQFFFPGKSLVGELIIHDIGFPLRVVQEQNTGMDMVGKDDFRSCVTLPPPTAHKYQCGKLLLVAGSPGYTGAACLAAMAAMRSGCGMVKLAVPSQINDVLEVKLTESITVPLPQTEQGTLSLNALSQILEMGEWADAVIIGPGVGLNGETSELVRKLVSNIRKPVVLDADGITAFQNHREDLDKTGAHLILTPHRGEFARISDIKLSSNPPALIEDLKSWIKKKPFTLLLKGAPTLVVSPEHGCLLSATGNAGMATAGSGDVLSGIIGAFLARGIKYHLSAGLGAYVHGLAGDMAARDLGVHGVIAGDLIDYLPPVFLQLLKS